MSGGFFNRWKQGLLRVTPLQQLRAKRNGIIGQSFGLVFAMCMTAWYGYWYFVPFLCFTLFLLLLDLVGTVQQVHQLEGL